jgi:hypothetical protein
LPIARDEWNFRDPGFDGGYLHVQELTPAERQKAAEAEEARAKKMAEDYKKSVAARRETEQRAEASFDAAVSDASVILTPEQQENKRLQLVKQPDGSLVHETELQRRAAQQEAEYEGGPTPAERAAMERYLASDEPEEDIWHDVEDDGGVY